MGNWPPTRTSGEISENFVWGVLFEAKCGWEIESVKVSLLSALELSDLKDVDEPEEHVVSVYIRKWSEKSCTKNFKKGTLSETVYECEKEILISKYEENYEFVANTNETFPEDGVYFIGIDRSKQF